MYDFQYDNIDEAHKGLFEGIFNCAAAPADGAMLAKLLAAVETHFTDEEVSTRARPHGEKFPIQFCILKNN